MRKKARKIKEGLVRLYWSVREQPAMGTVEIILIILVLIGLVIIFKDRITDLVETIFKKVTSQAGKV